MEKDLIIYHGSQQIVEKPLYGFGKAYNDYGSGFYCTENIELAKEWACPVKNDGFANKYSLPIDNLNVIHLTNGKFNILNWLAILLSHRNFDTSSQVGKNAKEFIINNFMPNIIDADVIIGYRADDSYFSFAQDFVNNTISLRDLNYAMKLGTLGEQVVLISKKAFNTIKFLGYEIADYREYYDKRLERDQSARNDYKSRKMNLKQLMDDIFVIDIMREDMKNDDSRLQSIIC